MSPSHRAPKEQSDLDSSETAPSPSHQTPSTDGLGIVLMGMAIATWGAMCGIGGGLFAVPLLHYVYKLTLKQSVVTSLGLVAATTISATLAEALRDDTALDWRVITCLVAGALIGAQFGFRVARTIDTRKLKIIFVAVLIFVAVRIFQIDSQGFDAPVAASKLQTFDFIKAVMIGFGGGFVSPLLGIGGGLVAVPALLILVPDLGHLGARACSMAMSVATSTRSMVLYYQAGDLDLRRAVNFGGGAAIGAFIGVQLVHITGVVEVAQLMLAGTLLAVAVRFAFDLRKHATPSKVS